MHIDDEVTARTAKASAAFGRLRTNFWEQNEIRLDTKLKVYKAVVLPTLLYAFESWTVYQRHSKKLNHFHLCCLRKLLKIRWHVCVCVCVCSCSRYRLETSCKDSSWKNSRRIFLVFPELSPLDELRSFDKQDEIL